MGGGGQVLTANLGSGVTADAGVTPAKDLAVRPTTTHHQLVNGKVKSYELKDFYLHAINFGVVVCPSTVISPLAGRKG